jgi:hypothetical protein
MTPKVFTIRILRPSGELRFEIDFRCATGRDEERLGRLVRRLAIKHRLQIRCGARAFEQHSVLGERRDLPRSMF